MPYRLQTDEHVQDGLRRCARERLDRAIAQLTERVSEDPVAAVHEARKALKQERSLLRLARGTLAADERRRDNAALRHAARTLSAARDAEVMLQALDELSERFAGQLPQAAFNAIRHRLEAERDPARQRLLDAGLTVAVADELRAGRSRIDEWSMSRGGWKALAPGLRRGYRGGRRAFAHARETGTAESLHEWRKRTKDLWYHLRLLKALSPAIIGGHADEAHGLSDLLGDDHDLALLRKQLRSGAGELAVDIDAVIELIDHRREQLQTEALLVGERLYAEPPKVFVRRIHRYWEASRAAREPVALAR
ncbi:MAG TPA: CHAD domain-containing protein [Solirubrobacteraceae bacterium]|nr:CHAD domain-containing protein [Solirubrobacteraceae bacterium]